MGRKELRALFLNVQRGHAGALAGTATESYSSKKVQKGLQRCRGSVREGRQELQQVFRECRGEFQGRKELLLFRQEG
jgi:hypothetical protein